MASNLRSRKGKNLSSDQKEPPPTNDEDSSSATTSNQTNNNTNNNNNDDKVKCAICLGDLVNRSYSNNCRHQFCFGCLLEWSKVKPECPLCKLTFTSIYHNIRAVGDWDVYQVPVIINDTLAHHIHVPSASMIHLHHLDGEMVTLRSHRFHPYGPSTGHLHFPTSYHRDHHQEYFRILVPLERRGALEQRNPFRTGQTEYFGTSVNLHNNEASSSSTITNYQSRRRIYDRGQYVIPFGSSLQGSSMNMFPSDEYIRNHSVSIGRISLWLHREITVLLGLRMSIDEMANVYDVIMNVLNNFDIRSRDFRELVHSYFGPVTRHFQHELYHFVLSGMRLEEYDRVAAYPSPNDGHHTNTSNINNHPASLSYASSMSGPPPVVTIDSGDENEDANSDVIFTSSSSSSGPPNSSRSTIENFGNLRSLAASARSANSSTSNPNLPWDLTMAQGSGGSSNDQSRPLTSDDFPALRLSSRRQRHEREREGNQEITESTLEDIIRRVASGDIEELFPDPTIANLMDHQETVVESSRRRAGRRGVANNIQELNDMDHRLQLQMESLRQARSRFLRQREAEENIEQIRNRNDQLRRTHLPHHSCIRSISQSQNPFHHSPSSHRSHQEEQVVQSTSEEDEECVLLGVHPVIKKPPLAVITISDSDDDVANVGGTMENQQPSANSSSSSNNNNNSSSHQFKNEVDYSSEIIQIPEPFHSSFFFQPCPLPSNSVTVSTTSKNASYSSRQTRSSLRVDPISVSLPSTANTKTVSNTSMSSKSNCHNSPSTSRKRKMMTTECSTSSKTRSQSGSSRRNPKQSHKKKKKMHHSSDASTVCSVDGEEEDENILRKDRNSRKRKSTSATKKMVKRKKSKRITQMINSSSSSDEDSDSSSSLASSLSSTNDYGDNRGHRGQKSLDSYPTNSKTKSSKRNSKRKKEKKSKSKKSIPSRSSKIRLHSAQHYKRTTVAAANIPSSRKLDYSSTDNSETEDVARHTVDTYRSNDRQQKQVVDSQSTDDNSSFDVQQFLKAARDLESENDGNLAYRSILLSSFSQSGNNMSSASSSSDVLENHALTSTDSQLSQSRHNQDDDIPPFLLDLTVARNEDTFWP